MKLSNISGGSDNNIGLLRFMGAFFVLYGHSYILVNGSLSGEDPVSMITRKFFGFSAGVPGIGVQLFFVISGFLITKSYVSRGSLLAFIEGRVLRIYPALIVTVLFSVFIVGAWHTVVPLKTYLLHRGTLAYLKQNTTMYSYSIQYYLPGVFENNPWPRGVNGSLWTLPVELLMYTWVAVIGILGFLKSRTTFNLFAVIIVLMYILSPETFPLLKESKHARLGIYFLLGAAAYINAEDIPLNLAMFGILCVGSLLVFKTSVYDLIFAITFTYAVMIVSFHPKIKLPKIDKYGDFSYGLYLYAFPVQQSIVKIWPGVKPFPLVMVAVTLLIALSLAILSWFFVEMPCMKLKGLLRQMTNKNRRG